MSEPATSVRPGSAALLTIRQLADYVGVTVRAIRHYHERGLLAEPVRDASGYRRYDARAVLELIRIKTLADAGVPLSRVDELLDADPDQLAAAVAEIDRVLEQQIRELEQRRRRIADLAGGERLFLPAPLVAFLDALHAAGVGERTVQLERDGWILLLARYPRQALAWLEDKHRRLADPDFQQLYRDFEQAPGWAPDDRRLDELAEAIARYLEQADDGGAARWDLDDPTVIALLTAHFENASSPALERLSDLVEQKRLARGPEL